MLRSGGRVFYDLTTRIRNWSSYNRHCWSPSNTRVTSFSYLIYPKTRTLVVYCTMAVAVATLCKFCWRSRTRYCHTTGIDNTVSNQSIAIKCLSPRISNKTSIPRWLVVFTFVCVGRFDETYGSHFHNIRYVNGDPYYFRVIRCYDCFTRNHITVMFHIQVMIKFSSDNRRLWFVSNQHIRLAIITQWFPFQHEGQEYGGKSASGCIDSIEDGAGGGWWCFDKPPATYSLLQR